MNLAAKMKEIAFGGILKINHCLCVTVVYV